MSYEYTSPYSSLGHAPGALVCSGRAYTVAYTPPYRLATGIKVGLQSGAKAGYFRVQRDRVATL
jgi:hypothetical protein